MTNIPELSLRIGIQRAAHDWLLYCDVSFCHISLFFSSVAQFIAPYFENIFNEAFI